MGSIVEQITEKLAPYKLTPKTHRIKANSKQDGVL